MYINIQADVGLIDPANVYDKINHNKNIVFAPFNRTVNADLRDIT